MSKNKDSFMNQIPMGLGMGLCRDMKAMENFTSLDEIQRNRLVERAKNAKSRGEMQSILKELSSGNKSFF